METSETYKAVSDNASPLEPLEKVEIVKWYNDPVYIKMCEKAEEIQEEHEWVSGDYLAGETELGKRIIAPVIESWWYQSRYATYKVMGGDERHILQKGAIWLPHQDQLQKMLTDYLCDKTKNYSIMFLLHKLVDSVNQSCLVTGKTKEEPYYYLKFASMEQLWLAFVMKKSHNKLWVNGEWVKEEAPA